MTLVAADLEADLVVIGAGPSGLYATYYAGFRGLSVVVIDALPQPGGQMAILYPEKPVFDVAGFPRVRAQDLVDSLVEQAALAEPHYLLGHRAVTLEQSPDDILITTDREVTVRGKALLMTGGMGGFRRGHCPRARSSSVAGSATPFPGPTNSTGRTCSSSAAATRRSTGRCASNPSRAA